ncbi:MAG: PilT/PilU family type 4a pilus ATPase [bacterium]
MALGQQMNVERILTRVAEYKASDLHLTVGMPPVLRVDGKLVTLTDEETVTPEFMESVLEQLMSDEQRATLAKDRGVLFTFDFGNKARFKVNVFYQRGYPSASLRFIPPEIRSVAELGLPAVVESFARCKKGLVIVSGSYGSGRSATLTALVNTINQERAEHIVSIENPIEYVYVNTKSVIEQREVGRDAPSFAAALKNIYQEDANVVVISELETPEVIEQALRIAATGRLVLTCMDMETAVQTIEKILSSFPTERQEQIRIELSECLQGVVVQRLLPRIGGGSVVIAEVLTVTPAIRSVIRDGAIYQVQTILQTSREEGMVAFDRSLADRVKTGEVLQDEAMKYATDQNTLRLMLRPLPER